MSEPTYRTADQHLLRELDGADEAAAYFGARANELRDSQLAGDSLLPGWTRGHVIAHVGYNAYALARLMTWAETGIETPMYASPEARDAEIEAGAALDPGSLHFLLEDSQQQLAEHWRRMDDAAWQARVRTRQGAEITASTAVWMRSRELWLHAVDLNSGAGFVDLPEPVLARLLRNVEKVWASREDAAGLRLRPAGAEGEHDGGAPAGAGLTVVSGPLPELAAWATGRSQRLELLEFAGDGFNGGAPGPAPRWL
ncbi:maleylpyruvate isomerase family mycothiol-dependent enzyme [Zhihengliuella salsuginis]|uniref:Maleylpyruvate isomerase n=1 Tax=Zhihengliuella salsuginis TaxID=578222 RepID=A0ABQ3GHQ3_9MICC|nr:maleylpyruvate isomerase family mycothiol-dependent enzyme [Zhihengliuella salsuginis]GHD05298.1 maleylpyruvate isomerase [Zhihengliuella salsuginis]